MGITVHADKRTWDELKAGLISAKPRVRVGVLSDETHQAEQPNQAPISMIELAAIHEFGAPAANIPERSFIRATLNNKRQEINKSIENFVGGAVRELLKRDYVSRYEIDVAARQALEKLGMRVVSLMRATIRKRETVGPEPQENKPATIEAKGSSTPLVGKSAQLINAISYVVDDSGGDDE